MPKKYHIAVKATPLDLTYVHKFKIERGSICINCGRCTKVCIYEAHARRGDDPRKMADPDTVACRNCFRCVQECPQGALVKTIDRDFRNLGGSYWKPDMLISLWKQAGDGKVPVSGAGYRGPFTGDGFDGMWTDMSEIVRPTRDGIHGREYISTSVELGRKLGHLTFDEEGRLASTIPPTIDLPIPIVFDLSTEELTVHLRAACVKAAAAINTFALVPAADLTPDLAPWAAHLIPQVAPGDIDRYRDLIGPARIIEVEYAPQLRHDLPSFREKVRRISRALVVIRVPAMTGVETIVTELARQGAEAIHLVADYRGREVGGRPGAPPRFIKEIIRSAHLALVEEGIRDELTIIASGGIAMAEHVPKAMLCGADLTAIAIPLLVALGARLYEEPQKIVILPDGLGQLSVETAAQRMVNLMGAWHSQLLEVMGAMGIREARRLRGETGRAIFFAEIDQETFGRLFKQPGTARA